MTTTPFSTVPAAYPGALPTGPVWDDPRSRRLWLGLPGNMIELPPPSASAGLSTAKSRGEQVHTLANGAAAITFLPNAARVFTYSWPTLTERDWQLLNGFYMRAFGPGPWCLVNPEGWNRLTRVQSLCLDPSVWATTAGTIVADSTPGMVAPGGTLLWSPSASGKILGPGMLSGSVVVPDTARAMVNVPAEPVTVSFWVQSPSGTVSVSARIVGKAATGPAVDTITGSAVTVGANWQQIAVVAAPGTFSSGSLYLIPEVVSNDGNPVRVSCPQAMYSATTAEWGMGGGVPRVLWTSGAPRDLRITLRAGMQITLSESGVG